jgi:hypothetical protein
MPSSKGKPTDPKLREKVKEEVKNKPNSDGGGKGQWSAWKVGISYLSPRVMNIGLPYTGGAIIQGI